MKKIYYYILVIIIASNTIMANATTTTTIEKVWSTYLGGTNDDFISDIKQTTEGNLILAGSSESADFPTSKGAYQENLKGKSNIILVSFDKVGNYLWGTYFGDSLTFCSKLLIDNEDNTYLIGTTADKTLPTVKGYQNNYGGGSLDAIIIKFDKKGNFINCTYFGGEGNEEITTANFDTEGNLIIGGNTTSKTNISSSESFQPIIGGYRDTFIFKINKELDKLIWSTYYGGEKDDYIYDFAIADNGDIVLSLSSSSYKIKISDNAYQKLLELDINNPYSRVVVLARFSSEGNLIYSTYFGKKYLDFNSITSLGNDEFICVGSNENYYLVTNDAYNKINTGGDPYIIRFKLKESFEPIYASYLNFKDLIYSDKVVVDKERNYIIIGRLNGKSDSLSYLKFTSSNATQKIGMGGYTDCFIAKFDNKNQVQYITLVGGNDLDLPNSLLYDNQDSTFYFAGLTTSDSNLINQGYYQNKRKGKEEAFLIKFKESIITSVLFNNRQLTCIYPNPARSTTRISLHQEGEISISAVDVLGRSFQLWSGFAAAGEMELDVTSVPTGTYTLLINYGTKVEAVRMIKE